MRMIQLIWELAHKEDGAFAASEPQAHILKKETIIILYNFINNFCFDFEDVRTTLSVMQGYQPVSKEAWAMRACSQSMRP